VLESERESERRLNRRVEIVIGGENGAAIAPRGR
jgi:hypothetical protein